jgi:hypothetical protein
MFSKLTFNSAMVRSVRSEAEDQGSKPGSVTSFFPKNDKKLRKKLGGAETRTHDQSHKSQKPDHHTISMFELRC